MYHVQHHDLLSLFLTQGMPGTVSWHQPEQFPYPQQWNHKNSIGLEMKDLLTDISHTVGLFLCV